MSSCVVRREGVIGSGTAKLVVPSVVAGCSRGWSFVVSLTHVFGWNGWWVAFVAVAGR